MKIELPQGTVLVKKRERQGVSSVQETTEREVLALGMEAFTLQLPGWSVCCRIVKLHFDRKRSTANYYRYYRVSIDPFLFFC